LNRELKTLKRTVVLEAWTNRLGWRALREIEDAYRRMVDEMVVYAVRHKASRETLHKAYYDKFRRMYPWLPTRVLKGCMNDAAWRAKSFRKKKVKDYTRRIAKEIIEFMGLNPKRDIWLIKKLWKPIYRVARSIALYQLELEIAEGARPEVNSVTIHYADPQDWRIENGVIKIRTHRGWVELYYRGNKQLWRYLYRGWTPARELRVKVVGGKTLVYLTLEKNFDIEYNPDNVVAVDINENNVTLAVFVGRKLVEFIRIETGLGRIVIAYSERRRRITKGKSTKDRSVRKALKRLREYERKWDIVYKTAKIIEDVARRYNARVVVGDVYANKDLLLEVIEDDRLRHRIHQWSASGLVKVLNQKPLHVESAPEAGSSSRDPFNTSRKLTYAPAVIRAPRVSGGPRRRVRVEKIVFRIARLSNGWVLDRDMVGSLSIGLRALSSDGRGVAFPSTGPHEVRVTLMNPHQGPTQTTTIPWSGKRHLVLRIRKAISETVIKPATNSPIRPFKLQAPKVD